MDIQGWFTEFLRYCTIGAIIAYVLAYIYLLFHDRDALRSEKYSLQKLAIERGLVGDSDMGTIDMDATKDVMLLVRKSKKNEDRS